MNSRHFLSFALLILVQPAFAQQKPSVSGIYPHLAYFNNEGECGTGAVVPWAGKLWVITYGPHLPNGSSDKLYEIDDALNAIIRSESIGGTPANRMIHKESEQLFIGPYAIDKNRNVRAIPYKTMFGRHTANMRHLSDPAGKIYYATMEEGFYEVDVKTLEVKELFQDGNKQKGDLGGNLLPGYHGKGAYSGQGRVVYANNGERGPAALKRPDIASGVLAEWDGKDWKVIRRNQFTEVTGPGGIHGNPNPATDPVWSVGWDHRSLILMLLDGGTWRTYRLPKASHTYDGAHGWNTEWPRIREIGEGDDLLMTMHGTFWKFPKTFSAANTAGIRPRATYLRVIGDFCKWNDRLVFGCDDTAKSEFLNKRKAKGNITGPGQSQSNLWCTDLSIFDRIGVPIGRGALWMNEATKAGEFSDPFLFAGYDRRAAHFSNGSAKAIKFDLEVDGDGKGQFKALRSVEVPAGGYAWADLSADKGEWIRIRTTTDAENITMQFHYSNPDNRPTAADPIFAGLAKPGDEKSLGGLIRARGDNKRTLAMAAMNVNGQALEDAGYYELDADMKLQKIDDAASLAYTRDKTAIPRGIVAVDAASVVYTDDAGKIWRLPRGDDALDPLVGSGLVRLSREVCTERDLFNAAGIFYELPADNAGGMTKVRPITTHNRRIMDYCSYRGMVLMTGINLADARDNKHIIRSDDGKAAVWAGAVDDLWRFGKAVGRGGPWKDSAVKANQPSDPYLMTGFDKKRLTLSSSVAANIRIEIDMTGDGHWAPYRSFTVEPNKPVDHEFPPSFSAYWLRAVADKDCTATAWLTYE